MISSTASSVTVLPLKLSSFNVDKHFNDFAIIWIPFVLKWLPLNLNCSRLLLHKMAEANSPATTVGMLLSLKSSNLNVVICFKAFDILMLLL